MNPLGDDDGKFYIWSLENLPMCLFLLANFNLHSHPVIKFLSIIAFSESVSPF